MRGIADNAAGFHAGSAYPGSTGNTVISGHHNVKGKVFRDLDSVPIGATVILYVGAQPYRYVVGRKMILADKDVPAEQQQENARWIAPTADERLSLVTCWPRDDNTHRLVVIARPATVESAAD